MKRMFNSFSELEKHSIDELNRHFDEEEEMKLIVTIIRENAEAQLHAVKEELKQAQRDRGLSSVAPDLLICRAACLDDLINVLGASEKELK